jgi:hypothetical protein
LSIAKRLWLLTTPNLSVDLVFLYAPKSKVHIRVHSWAYAVCTSKFNTYLRTFYVLLNDFIQWFGATEGGSQRPSQRSPRFCYGKSPLCLSHAIVYFSSLNSKTRNSSSLIFQSRSLDLRGSLSRCFFKFILAEFLKKS